MAEKEEFTVEIQASVPEIQPGTAESYRAAAEVERYIPQIQPSITDF